MAATNEFCRPIVIEPWPDGDLAVELCADSAERRALARRFGLLEIGSLHASGRLERTEQSGEIRFHGRLEAEVVQACVVSLEPVAATVRTSFARRYHRIRGAAAHGAAVPQHHDWMADEDEVEPLTGRTIDLGEAIAEELALALDPYPRAADADTLVSQALGPNISLGAVEPAETPFAALGQLKEKRVR